ncbi:unnamed protein product [Sympodiomycopsis kandeliae]
MTIHEPKKRHQGFVIPHQPGNYPHHTALADELSVPNGTGSPSSFVDTSLLLPDADFWNREHSLSKNSAGDHSTALNADPARALSKGTIQIGQEASAQDAKMQDITDMDDMWSRWMSSTDTGPFQSGHDSIDPTKLLKTASPPTDGQSDATPSSTGGGQLHSPLFSGLSVSSGPSTNSDFSLNSNEAGLTNKSVHSDNHLQQSKTALRSDPLRNRSFTISGVDLTIPESMKPAPLSTTPNAPRHGRSMSQSTSSRPKPSRRATGSNETGGPANMIRRSPSVDRNRVPPMKVCNASIHGGFGKAPRSRSRPSLTASVGPAAQAASVKSGGSSTDDAHQGLRIDTSPSLESMTSSSRPHTVSGIPVPWSASPWMQGYGWSPPFGPSGAHGPTAMPHGWPPWPPYHPGMWANPAMMTSYPFASPPPPPPPGSHGPGNWVYSPCQPTPSPMDGFARSLPANAPSDFGLGAVTGSSNNKTPGAANTNGNATQSGVEHVMEGVSYFDGNQQPQDPQGDVSLDEFLRDHKMNTLFSPCGPEVAIKAEISPTKELEQSKRGRRASRSSELCGRKLEDVPESKTINSRSPAFKVAEGAKEREASTGANSVGSEKAVHKKSPGVHSDAHLSEKQSEVQGAKEKGKPTMKQSQTVSSPASSPLTAKKVSLRGTRSTRPDSEKRKRRRESHNLVERRRRDAINERIAELASLLPETMLLDAIAHSQSGGNNSKVVKVDMPPTASNQQEALDALASAPADSETLAAAQARPNKGIILKKSVDYIRILQDFINQQANHNRRLQEEMNRISSQVGHQSGGADVPSDQRFDGGSPQWAIERLASTFDLSRFETSGHQTSQGENLHPSRPYDGTNGTMQRGESPPQTLADWLAGTQTQSHSQRVDDDHDHDMEAEKQSELFSDSDLDDDEEVDGDVDVDDEEDDMERSQSLEGRGILAVSPV